MGSGMARNLLRAGHQVTVYNRSRKKAEALAGVGARMADSPADVCRGAEAVVTMLADDGAVEQVVLGENGIAASLPSQGIHVSCSTIGVALAKRLTAQHDRRGQGYVSAPVFGRPDAEALMRGDLARALIEVRDQYDTGADPAMVLGDLAEFTHFVTRVKIVPALADDVSLTETERTRGRAFAGKLSMRVFARTWQMLLKGMEEVAAAGRPLAAAEMVLVRIAYAADLPTPDEVIRSLGDSARGNGGAPSPSQPSSRVKCRWNAGAC